MATGEVDTGFEALLRPIQDILTKNWEVTLTKYLEEYLKYLRVIKDPNTNFCEAAMLLQNSTHFYCRRVDLVFEFMIKLIEDLTEKYNSVFGLDESEPPARLRGRKNCSEKSAGDGGATGAAAPKRKRPNKSLQCEELKLLDNVYSEHKIDLRLDKKNSKLERKSIVLNKTIKAQPKTNTSCPVYQTKGKEIGLKEEFRLHWRISSDGTLHSDIINTERVTNHSLANASFHDDNLLDGGGRMEGDDVMGGRVSESDPLPGQEEPLDHRHDDSFINHSSPSPQPPSDISDNEDPVVSPPKERPRRRGASKKTESAWEPSGQTARLQVLKLKKKKTYKLPKNFVEAKTLCRKEEEGKSGGEAPTFLCHSPIIWNKKEVHPFDYMMEEEVITKHGVIVKRRTSARLREKLMAEYEKELAAQPPLDNDDDDDHDHDDGFDCDDIGDELDEEESEALRPVDVELVNIQSLTSHKDSSSYEMDAQIVMEKYQAQVKYNTNLDLEIARRVEKWHERLEPVLRVAEARSEFDVQDYCSRILDNFPMVDDDDEGEVTPFSTITRGQPKEEICRFFLSTLMLANTYNVEVIRTEEGDLTTDCVGVRLLSRVRHHEELDDNLRATSANYYGEHI